MPQPSQPPAPAPQPPSHYVTPAAKSSRVPLIIASAVAVLAVGAAVWAFMQYVDIKNTLDGRVDNAVALAVKEQKEKDAEIMANAEKEPNRLFVGPEDYGRLAFNYPKTWSMYEASDAADGGTYEAYFNPVMVPGTDSDQRYALRLTIEDDTYENVLSNYESLVESGELKSSRVTLGDEAGTRLDGNFSDDVRGSAVIIKIRDKTVILQTDATTFTQDFNALITTITFNK